MSLVPDLKKEHQPVAEVYLTYSNLSHTDGGGAQLYRIYGIYALSRAVGLRYLHTPLAQIDFQGLAAVETQCPDDMLVERFNALCNIPSDAIPPQDADWLEIPDPEPGFEQSLLQASAASGRALVAAITHPHHILDQAPDALKICGDVSPYRCLPWKPDRPLRVAIHVRRGDVHFLDPQRLLPNAYYIGVALRLKAALQDYKVPHVLEIHSEFSAKNFEIKPDGYGVYNLDRTVSFDPSADSFDEFKSIPDVKFVFNEETVASFSNIATADVIVTSKSCFSYLGAILNPQAAVIYHPFWHAPLGNWIVSSSDGQFDDSAIRSLIERGLKAPRSQTAGSRLVGWLNRFRMQR